MWKLANSNRNWHHSRWDKRLEHPANQAEEPAVENGKTNKNQVQDAEDSPSNFEGKMQLEEEQYLEEIITRKIIEIFYVNLVMPS